MEKEKKSTEGTYFSKYLLVKIIFHNLQCFFTKFEIYTSFCMNNINLKENYHKINISLCFLRKTPKFHDISTVAPSTDFFEISVFLIHMHQEFMYLRNFGWKLKSNLLPLLVQCALLMKLP